jgi:hypothetical protein
MATTHKPFRELVRDGTHFEFVGRTRVWVTISLTLVLGSIAMLFVNNAVRGDYLNWTIDFKGGTEVIFGFKDKASGEWTSLSSGEIRGALAASDDPHIKKGFEVSDFSWTVEKPDGAEQLVKGMLIRTPSFGAVSDAKKDEVLQAFEAKFSEPWNVLKASWSGDRLYARTTTEVDPARVKELMAGFDLEMRDWEDDEAESYNTTRAPASTTCSSPCAGWTGSSPRCSKTRSRASPSS